MKIEQDSLKPIYVQIAEGIEDDILRDILEEDEQAYSQNQIAKRFGINPATAAKGLTLLVEDGVLYRKRGLGMHVSLGAKSMIQKKRRDRFVEEFISQMIIEARKLGISKEDLKNMIDDYSLLENNAENTIQYNTVYSTENNTEHNAEERG